MKTLEQIKNDLKKYGYNVTIPANANYVSVMGSGKGFFKAKKAKAESIVSYLIYLGFNAKMVKHIDGYFDFYVYQ